MSPLKPGRPEYDAITPTATSKSEPVPHPFVRGGIFINLMLKYDGPSGQYCWELNCLQCEG